MKTISNAVVVAEKEYTDAIANNKAEPQLADMINQGLMYAKLHPNVTKYG